MAKKGPIRATFRSKAINANGKPGGIPYPSPKDQEAVMEYVYESAGGFDSNITEYVERS